LLLLLLLFISGQTYSSKMTELLALLSMLFLLIGYKYSMLWDSSSSSGAQLQYVEDSES